MKFIDKHGKIFGKINIIDATIVLLLVFIVTVYAGLIKKTVSVKDTFKRETVIIKLEIKELPEEIYGLVKVGDRNVNTNLGFYGVLEKIRKIGSKKRKIGKKTEESVDFMVWIKVRAYHENGLMVYQSREIKPGTWFSFPTRKYSIAGNTLEIIKDEKEKLSGTE